MEENQSRNGRRDSSGAGRAKEQEKTANSVHDVEQTTSDRLRRKSCPAGWLSCARGVGSWLDAETIEYQGDRGIGRQREKKRDGERKSEGEGGERERKRVG